MNLMPVHTAQSTEFMASVKDASARMAGARATPHLLSTDNPEVLRQCPNGMQTRHKIMITTRTSIQDPSIQPPKKIYPRTGEFEGEEGFWVEDEEGLEGFMATNDDETFGVLEENDAFIARKVSGQNPPTLCLPSQPPAEGPAWDATGCFRLLVVSQTAPGTGPRTSPRQAGPSGN